MKTLLTLFFLATICYAQAPKADFKIFNASPIKGDYLWAAHTEVTNFQYKEFLWHVKTNKSESAYIEMLPDTTVWRNSGSYNEPYVEYYFNHPAYNDYPVVGISKAQAEAYCEWLDGILTQTFKNDPDHPVQKLTVRLPTDEEWKHAARGGDRNAIFPWKGSGMRHTDKKFQGSMMANFVRGRGDYMGVAGSLNDNADITAPARSYWPNGYGLYNMSGNVAEMLQEEGRTRGGSWRNRAPYLQIDGEDPYAGFSEASSQIGFRYFIEVESQVAIKEKKPVKFNAKYIEKLMVYVLDSTYVSTTEVTNELYNIFLHESGQTEHSPQNELWLGEVAYATQYMMDYAVHPKYTDHPVVNISRESAHEFCNWLSKVYNGFDKKKYENLKFRLPTEEEWTRIAHGGLTLSSYPWGGPYLRNSKGCFLSNHNPVEERWVLDSDTTYLIPGLTKEQIREAGSLDGLLITGPVTSYHPNDYGVYCMSGNVAEMVADEDFVKGGSWGSFQQYTQISSREPYEGPSPFVGFRFVAIQEKAVVSSKD